MSDGEVVGVIFRDTKILHILGLICLSVLGHFYSGHFGRRSRKDDTRSWTTGAPPGRFTGRGPRVRELRRPDYRRTQTEVLDYVWRVKVWTDQLVRLVNPLITFVNRVCDGSQRLSYPDIKTFSKTRLRSLAVGTNSWRLCPVIYNTTRIGYRTTNSQI